MKLNSTATINNSQFTENRSVGGPAGGEGDGGAIVNDFAGVGSTIRRRGQYVHPQPGHRRRRRWRSARAAPYNDLVRLRHHHPTAPSPATRLSAATAASSTTSIHTSASAMAVPSR